MYRGRVFEIEPDASAASYFFAAAAIAGGRVTVLGLSRDSLQGDVAFCDCLAQMGCEVEHSTDRITVIGGPLRGIDVDMNAISDTVQTLAAVALFADGPTTIRNVAHIRHKETDRIGNLAAELRKLGAEVEEWPDGMRITAAAAARRGDRYLRRSSHGDESGSRRLANPGNRPPRSAMHGEDVSGLFPRSRRFGRHMSGRIAFYEARCRRSIVSSNSSARCSSKSPESCGG